MLAGYGMAATLRTEIAAAFPGYEPNHGFMYQFTVTPGPHRMRASRTFALTHAPQSP